MASIGSIQSEEKAGTLLPRHAVKKRFIGLLGDEFCFVSDTALEREMGNASLQGAGNEHQLQSIDPNIQGGSSLRSFYKDSLKQCQIPIELTEN